MKVNVFEAKNRLSELIRSARAGEEVIIANRGEPIARLVAIVRNHLTDEGNGTARRILDWLNARSPGGNHRSNESIEADIDRERRAWD